MLLENCLKDRRELILREFFRCAQKWYFQCCCFCSDNIFSFGESNDVKGEKIMRRKNHLSSALLFFLLAAISISTPTGAAENVCTQIDRAFAEAAEPSEQVPAYCRLLNLVRP